MGEIKKEQARLSQLQNQSESFTKMVNEELIAYQKELNELWIGPPSLELGADEKNDALKFRNLARDFLREKRGVSVDDTNRA